MITVEEKLKEPGILKKVKKEFEKDWGKKFLSGILMMDILLT